MLIEKEIVAPGDYWYIDENTQTPRVLNVTPDLNRYWLDQGNKMVAAGLPIPVPYEHDFTAHPMTPKDKLLNNSGWIKEYRLRDEPDPITKEPRKDVLFGVLDIQDEDIAQKLPTTIRWTSPWINSFTDGSGKQWNNVISHLALTTRPRITKQSPFPSIAAALSIATPTEYELSEQLYNHSKSPVLSFKGVGANGICLTDAGRLINKNKQLQPRYSAAFSMLSGVSLASDKPAPKKSPVKNDKGKPGAGKGTNPLDKDTDGIPDSIEEQQGGNPAEESDEGKLKGPGDKPEGAEGEQKIESTEQLKMEEILCHLLQALGVPMPDSSNPDEFHRHLYEAAMSKIKELTSMGMGKEQFKPDQNKPPNQQKNASQPNPIIGQVQQEQQPMYMSLEEINSSITDPVMKKIALSMYAENEKLRAEAAASKKTVDSLLENELKKANAARQQRIAMLSKLSPKVKDDLEKMIGSPSMALSMGDGGVINDPMEMTLKILENSLSSIPKLLTLETSALSVHEQPQDGDKMTEERENEIANIYARAMGCPPEKKAS